jgi:hypothetical protein
MDERGKLRVSVPAVKLPLTPVVDPGTYCEPFQVNSSSCPAAR